MVGAKWEEVQKQREHSVPFLHIGADKKSPWTPPALCTPPPNELVGDAPGTSLSDSSFALRCFVGAVVVFFFFFGVT